MQEIARKIVENFRPDKIILFGSHAYGKPGPDSDVDLLVIMRSRKRPAARATDISLACHPGTISMDILVRTPSEIERLRTGFRPFWQEVLAKGKILYDRNGKS
ncbi:MAG: nucleotidyltransferase domain-containing protein [Nitrospirae bacterium]|nr:nucleotidyltransferase domain-containing protein [Nitrospirota bacterium]